MKERSKEEKPKYTKKPISRFWIPGWDNPLAKWGSYLVFLLCLLNLTYLGFSGSPLPDVGTKATSYYVAPRSLVCAKPNPAYDVLVQRAEAEQQPIYRHDTSSISTRVTELRSLRKPLEETLAVLREHKSLPTEAAPKAKTSHRVRPSRFYQGEQPVEPDGDQELEQMQERMRQNESERQAKFEAVVRILAQIAPRLPQSELEKCARSLRDDPALTGELFSALEVLEVRVRDWYLIGSYSIGMQADLARGVLVESEGRPLAVPSQAPMLISEATESLATRVIPETVRSTHTRLFREPAVVAVLTRAVNSLMTVPTFFPVPEATRAAVERSVAAIPASVNVEFQEGQSVIALGETVEEWQRDCISRFSTDASGMSGTALGLDVNPSAILMFGIALMILMLMVAGKHLASRIFPDRKLEAKDALAVGFLVLMHFALLRSFLFGASAFTVAYPGLTRAAFLVACPVGAAIAVMQVLLGARVALLSLVFLIVPTAILAQQSGPEIFAGRYPLYFLFYTLSVSLTGIWVTRRVLRRSSFLLAGLWHSLIGSCIWGLVYMFEAGQIPPSHMVQLVIAAIISGIITSIMLIVVVPIFEYVWDYTTPSRLLELSSTEHRAFKDLAKRASGTYQHSLFIAALVEDAAEGIGANALLARVGAYYHDLGKLAAVEEGDVKFSKAAMAAGLARQHMDSPLLFAENQTTGGNPHDLITAESSVAVLKRHVAQSVAMIDRYRLGRRIRDIAAQHHGTTLIEHFYSKALLEAEMAGTKINERDFRYPGPKPQSKEAALVMLADSVEAAVRSLAEHTVESITAKVKRIIEKRMSDGQLDESGLTLGNVRSVESSFIKTLISMYHARPEYKEASPDSSTNNAISRKILEDHIDEVTQTSLSPIDISVAGDTKSGNSQS